MIATESPHVFVYGTLMASATGTLGRDMRLRLRREARLIGPATIRGRLYDLGRYPAFVASSEPADIVYGELLELTDAAVSLPWLDAYEGVERGTQAIGEYLRVRVTAALASGDTQDSWVYEFNRPVVGLPRVRSGRWKSAP
jgi:gamma-glutamylcyclotransferase (GGCT)/AIG2-like uncharacterized protein YtfP